MDDLAEFYADSVVLVTGAAGTIGSGLVKRLSDFDVAALRALDNNETGLFDLERELRSQKVRTFVGDIRDKGRLERAFEGVDVVFHCAALKHVPLCEYNPFEAAKTNVFGTQNVIEAALDKEIGALVLISTDKTVNPLNVMGATKLVAERLVIAANQYKGNRETKFSCVRFGNVLDSRGSVLPIFKNQIDHGGPVTLTDREMTRFVITIDDAVALILNAGATSKGGEIYVPKLPSLNVRELAEAMIEMLAQKNGYRPSDIKLTETGKRKGEKMYEELMTEDEARCACDTGGYFVLNCDDDVCKQNDFSGYNSKEARKLSKDEITQLLEKVYR
jgi:UDP-N-acetylglucosamine 4,6-dehydratase/5-epimerase